MADNLIVYAVADMKMNAKRDAGWLTITKHCLAGLQEEHDLIINGKGNKDTVNNSPENFIALNKKIDERRGYIVNHKIPDDIDPKIVKLCNKWLVIYEQLTDTYQEMADIYFDISRILFNKRNGLDYDIDEYQLFLIPSNRI